MTTDDVFREDSGDRAYVAVADDFQPGVSLADGRRALAARRAFAEEMLHDPRVVQVITRWLKVLVTAPEKLSTDDVLALVRDQLGLRWPWCCVALLDVFHTLAPSVIEKAKAAVAKAGGMESVEITLNFDASDIFARDEVAVHAPSLNAFFAILDGEGTNEARARWTALNDRIMAELAEADNAAAGGRSPKGDAEHLAKGARWFYQCRIARPTKSQREMSRENKVDRKTIRDGIRKAEQLLSLGAFTFPSGGPKLEETHP